MIAPSQVLRTPGRRITVKLLLPVFMGLVLLAVFGWAFGDDADASNIERTELGTGYDADTQEVTGATTSFSRSDTFHCVIEVADAPEDSTVRTAWTAVEVTDSSGKAIEDRLIGEAAFSVEDADSAIDATLDLPNPWPVGKYKVDIYLNDNLERTLEFAVDATPEGALTD